MPLTLPPALFRCSFGLPPIRLRLRMLLVARLRDTGLPQTQLWRRMCLPPGSSFFALLPIRLLRRMPLAG
jgi:hypothetical protein